MAGPGGGPPRRSHTKSRNGCNKCKKRHIRCDETFPQCLNCTKHKSRCTYNDVSHLRSTTPDKPDLMWTPKINAIITKWRLTGVYPFPGMGIYPDPTAEDYTIEELRLIHHVANIYTTLEVRGATGFTVWAREIPKIIQLGVANRYVMDSLLAFSAGHIAQLTTCSHVGNMALTYRGSAMSGLSLAIASFSAETSDAILAASMVLSWQETNWRDWTRLMDGTASVIKAMKDCQHQSQFLHFIRERSTIPTGNSSPIPDRRPMQPEPADVEAFARALTRVQKLEAYLKSKRQDTKLVHQLLTFMKAARRVPPSRSPEDQFKRLRDLLTWLFWLPVRCFQDTEILTGTLIVIAHYYAVALLAERLFTGTGAAYFGSLSMGPMDEISRRIYSLRYERPDEFNDYQEFIQFPIETVTEFQAKYHHHDTVPELEDPSPRLPWCQTSPYSTQATTSPFLEPAAAASGYSVYAGNTAFSYSTESLALSLGGESEPASAASPVSMVSPFISQQQPQPVPLPQPLQQLPQPQPLQQLPQPLPPPPPQQQHYLNIPSPSYVTTAYSPASSTFDGALSDTEEYGMWDGCFNTAGGSLAPFGYHHQAAATPRLATGLRRCDASMAGSATGLMKTLSLI